MRPEARFTSSFGFIARSWRRIINTALTRFGLSEATALPLVHLGRVGGGITQIELANHLGIGGPSLVRALDRLVAAGYIDRCDDPADKRVKRIRLTPDGEEITARIEAEIDRLRAIVMKDISAEELAVSLSVLERFRTAIDQLETQPAVIAGEAEEPRS